MYKRVISFALIIMIVFTTNVFAFKWEKENGEWCAIDDNAPIRLCNQFLSDGAFNYMTDSNGMLITGWYVKPDDKKVYFFDNIKESAHYGAMVFSLKSIDGRLYYFTNDGSLAKANKRGEYIKAFINGADEYWADSDGALYLNNQLMIVKNSDYTVGYSWNDYKDVSENINEIAGPAVQ